MAERIWKVDAMGLCHGHTRKIPWGCIIELQVVEENDNMNNRMTVTDADVRGERRMLRKSVSQKQRDG